MSPSSNTRRSTRSASASASVLPKVEGPSILREVSLNPIIAQPSARPIQVEEVKVKAEAVDATLDVSLTFARLSIQSRSASVTARRTREGSVMSVEDAQSTVDAFFAQEKIFTSDKDNKLRLWQSLCIEFGLVKIDGAELSMIKEESDTDSYDDTSLSYSSTEDLPPIPTSLNQANKLLKAKAHVNLKDYLSERKNRRGGPAQDLSHLVFPSASAMMKYTRKNKRFAKLSVVKSEWLNPLLRTFNRH